MKTRFYPLSGKHRLGWKQGDATNGCEHPYFNRLIAPSEKTILIKFERWNNRLLTKKSY
jgi:hypothetical protein